MDRPPNHLLPRTCDVLGPLSLLHTHLEKPWPWLHPTIHLLGACTPSAHCRLGPAGEYHTALRTGSNLGPGIAFNSARSRFCPLLANPLSKFLSKVISKFPPISQMIVFSALASLARWCVGARVREGSTKRKACVFLPPLLHTPTSHFLPSCL